MEADVIDQPVPSPYVGESGPKPYTTPHAVRVLDHETSKRILRGVTE